MDFYGIKDTTPHYQTRTNETSAANTQRGYDATGIAQIDSFYANLSAAAEKSTGEAKGKPIGMTTVPYDDTNSYGMVASYSDASTPEDPVIRVSSNYGGEQRYYDVHVNEVNPRKASQLEMFALASYQDDQGITERGSFGSYSRMKTYMGNAALNGYGADIHDPANASGTFDWVEMLRRGASDYLGNPDTYSQFLDAKGLADALDRWGGKYNGYDPTDVLYASDEDWEKFLERIDHQMENVTEDGQTLAEYVEEHSYSEA